MLDHCDIQNNIEPGRAGWELSLVNGTEMGSPLQISEMRILNSYLPWPGGSWQQNRVGCEAPIGCTGRSSPDRVS